MILNLKLLNISKSTLLLQVCSHLCQNGKRVLYVSGEESAKQLKLRARRLNIDVPNLYVLAENSLDGVEEKLLKLAPDVAVVDSIQTMSFSGIASSSGSVTQVKECTSILTKVAKKANIAVLIVGHVNKEGGIAGPKVLEHMVDAVLYFEGERSQPHRIVRAIKNRYGSTNEIGVFEMDEHGLSEVENPSAMLLAERPTGVSGSCAVCIMEGTRPLIAEIQALVTPTTFPAPRRTSNGIDYNRMCLLLAVLEKRLGLRFSTCDVYLNVIGGLRIDDPGADAAVALALISSLRDVPIPPSLIAMGEIGLAGEFRTVSSAAQRVGEASRLGFTRIALPKRCITDPLKAIAGASLSPLGGIFDAMTLLGSEK